MLLDCPLIMTHINSGHETKANTVMILCLQDSDVRVNLMWLQWMDADSDLRGFIPSDLTDLGRVLRLLIKKTHESLNLLRVNVGWSAYEPIVWTPYEGMKGKMLNRQTVEPTILWHGVEAVLW